jgi:hypothetical protein
MSQDLFAAFGVPKDTNKQTGRASSSTTEEPFSVFSQSSTSWASEIGATSHNGAAALVQDDDDDWGEFEGAEEVKPVLKQLPIKQVPSATSRYQYSLDDLGSSQFSQGKLSLTESLSVQPSEKTSKATSQGREEHSRDPNVLFDASDDGSDGGNIDDFDDFGDFEQPEIPIDMVHDAITVSKSTMLSKPSRNVNIDLLGLGDGMDASDIQPIKDKTFHNVRTSQPAIRQKEIGVDLLALDGEGAFTPKQRSEPNSFQFGQTSNVVDREVLRRQNLPNETEASQNDEKWEDFSAWDDDDNQSKMVSNEIPSDSQASGLGAFKGASDSSKISQPPTTIPPPAVVLSIFPSIFESIEAQLFHPLSGQVGEVRQKVFSDPATLNYLRGYRSILIVCAHVIAGRKLRWKGDTILSQSMRIGPASSGRLSGMKVTSLDKSEINREDREVAEVVRLWNLQIGKVKAVLAEAKKVSEENLPLVPDIRETMPVKTASELEGGISSLKPCALCGLKRSERVGKVDIEVEDTFGEWWDENVIMHRGLSISKTQGAREVLMIS